MSGEGTEQESTVLSQHPHPDYDPDTVSDDIALLKLKKPFKLDDHTRAACLPDGDGVGHTGIILGWGELILCIFLKILIEKSIKN